MRRVGVVVVLVTALLAGCGKGRGSGEGTLHAAGDVTVNGSRADPSGVALSPGSVVDVRSGAAVVDLGSGKRLELRTGSLVRFHGGPELEGGDLLAEAGKTPVRISTSIADLTVTGAARLRRDLALEVGTYRGTVAVSTGRTLDVPALQQDTIASLSVAPVPGPLYVDGHDPWDLRFLGTAVDLTEQLDSASRYVTANVASGVSVVSYRADLGDAKAGMLTDALLRSVSPSASTPPGDTIAAAAIALAGRGDFVERFRRAFALRAAGAQWGIVALDEAADPAVVLQLLNRAVQRASLQLVVAAPASAAPTSGTTQPATPGGAPAATTTTAVPATSVVPHTTVTPRVTPGTTPAATPPTSPPTTLPPNPLAPVLNPVTNLINSLLGQPAGH